MTLDEVLTSLFPEGHDVKRVDRGLLRGSGALQRGRALVLGVADQSAVGLDEAIQLSAWVLEAVEGKGADPILILVDSDSQRMSKRDELLGLNEFLAHLAKCLIHADAQGHHTIALLYGHSAAGAFIATGLATRTLVALPSARPEVMDLPSIARVTKLPIDLLKIRADSTSVFAPGLANLAKTGAVHHIWDENIPLALQLRAILGGSHERDDQRDRLGAARRGRVKAAEIARRVCEIAIQLP